MNNSIRDLDCTIACLGVGGVGSWSTFALASIGVRRFKLLDADRVEESNLNRQVAYCPADLGRVKVEVMAERLRSWVGAEVEIFNTHITNPEDAYGVLGDCDFAVCAVDQPRILIRETVMTALRKMEVTGIFATHSLPMGSVGPLFIPGRPGCAVCCDQSTARSLPYMMRDFVYESGCAPSYPACSALLASIVAEQVRQYIVGEDPELFRTRLRIDFRNWEQERWELKSHEECSCCQSIDQGRNPKQAALTKLSHV